MSDFQALMERLVVDPAFVRSLATDPVHALDGYTLSNDERRIVLGGVSADPGRNSRVEQRTSKAGLFGLGATLGDLVGAITLGGSGGGSEGLASAIQQPPVGPASDVVFSGPDADQDGLPDVFEDAFGTDKHNQDSDHDGILDGFEVDMGTDPSAADTDGDGYDDFAEIANGTDPTDQADHPTGPVPTQSLTDPYGDQDHDGLTDAEEWAYGTNPADADTDGDGATDGAELAHGTDPTKADSWDIAGLLDIDGASGGNGWLPEYHIDLDGDGLNDLY